MRPLDIASSAAAFVRQNSLLNSVGSAARAIFAPLKHAAAAMLIEIGKRPGMSACLIAASIIAALVIWRPNSVTPEPNLFDDPAFETVEFATDDDAPPSSPQPSTHDEPSPLLSQTLPKLVPGGGIRTPSAEASSVTTADAIESPANGMEAPGTANRSLGELPQWPHRGTVAQADFQAAEHAGSAAPAVPGAVIGGSGDNGPGLEGAQLLGTIEDIEELEERPVLGEAPREAESAFSFPPRN